MAIGVRVHERHTGMASGEGDDGGREGRTPDVEQEGEAMVSIEVSAEIVSELEAIVEQEGFGSVADLLREIVTSYSEVPTPTPEERQDALEAAYQSSAEGEAERWARGILTR